ncbi:MAG: MFS transporter [Alphaproteobacteria bacterium]|nr:MFS transporter [Alphaproteobacteria bacterium]
MSLLSPSPPLSQLTARQVNWIGAGYVMIFSTMAGQTIFIAQFNTVLREAFNLSDGQFGALYTIATLASSVVLVWAGVLADRWAARTLALWCIVGLASMALLMSVVGHVAILGLALFGLRFFGQGMLSHVALTTMSRWFNRYRGRALAISQLGLPTGQAFLPLAVTLAIATVGWRQVWAGTALLLVLGMVPLIALLLANPPDGRKAKARGEINPDGGAEKNLTGASWTRRQVLRDPLFYLIIPGMLASPAIGTLYVFHQASLIALKGWDLTVFTALYPVFAATAVATSLFTGMLIDRIGAWRLLWVILLPLLLSSMVVASLGGVTAIVLLLGLLGMSMGMSAPVLGAVWAELYGTTHLGAIRALVTSGMVFASAVGPGLAGVLLDLGVELDIQAIYYSAYSVACGVIYIVIRGRLAARARQLSGVPV